MLHIAGRPVWWVVLLLIPFVNFAVAIVIGLDIARNFARASASRSASFCCRSCSIRSGFSDAQYSHTNVPLAKLFAQA